MSKFKTKHVIVINGRENTRTSETRVYTHAVAVLDDAERARTKATTLTPTERKYVLQNHAHYVGLVVKGPDANDLRNPDRWACVVAWAALTPDAYCEHVIAEAVKEVNRKLAKGEYLWAVHTWNGSKKLADKEAHKQNGFAWVKKAVVLEVGANVTLDGDVTE